VPHGHFAWRSATGQDIIRAMTKPRPRLATPADLPRISVVRSGTAENRLIDPSAIDDEEVEWYMNAAIFLVSEDESGIQGFTCVNHQTGYVWALFVIDEAQGRGHGTSLLDAAMTRLREAGHRQAFLKTGRGTKAEAFYRSKGWRLMGPDVKGDSVYRLWL
jgi:GNAT superfamily N-acetyltransferase